VGHRGESRAALQLDSQGLELRSVADGIYLYPPVEQVLYISRDPQLLGGALGEKTKAHALHISRHQISLRLSLHGAISRGIFLAAARL
jgi:hypothetical protein